MRGKGGQCIGLISLPPSCADSLLNLGVSTSWNPQGLSRSVMGLLYLFTSLNKEVLHTIRAEAANIKASYVNINSMESNWIIQSEQQMEKNSFGNLFGYKYDALNPFQGFKKEIPCVVTLASTGYNVGSSFITHSPDNWLVLSHDCKTPSWNIIRSG